jgi:hypothetical protein
MKANGLKRATARRKALRARAERKKVRSEVVRNRRRKELEAEKAAAERKAEFLLKNPIGGSVTRGPDIDEPISELYLCWQRAEHFHARSDEELYRLLADCANTARALNSNWGIMTEFIKDPFWVGKKSRPSLKKSTPYSTVHYVVRFVCRWAERTDKYSRILDDLISRGVDIDDMPGAITTMGGIERYYGFLCRAEPKRVSTSARAKNASLRSRSSFPGLYSPNPEPCGRWSPRESVRWPTSG